MQEHQYSLTELENMMPWERAIYVSMLVEHLNKNAEKEKHATVWKLLLCCIRFGFCDGKLIRKCGILEKVSSLEILRLLDVVFKCCEEKLACRDHVHEKRYVPRHGARQRGL